MGAGAGAAAAADAVAGALGFFAAIFAFSAAIFAAVAAFLLSASDTGIGDPSAARCRFAPSSSGASCARFPVIAAVVGGTMDVVCEKVEHAGMKTEMIELGACMTREAFGFGKQR
jgi:hypothetical protein